MNKKYQVFVSSTFKDLVEERQDAIRSVLDLQHFPAGMEVFPAADTEQLTYIKKIIDECDYYILIIGGRYGSTDAEGVSFTEREYDYAVESGKFVLAFIHKNVQDLIVAKVDTEQNAVKRLNAFKEKVSNGRLVQFWTDRQDLKSKVIISLTKAFSDSPSTGWVRADTVGSTELLSEVHELRKNNDELSSRLTKLIEDAKPLIENIADLDDRVEIRVAHTVYQGASPTQRREPITITWREILGAIGPSLTAPKTPDVIQSCLTSHVKENRGFEGRLSVHITETDCQKVKVQLAALGLVENFVAEKVGGGQTEFIRITQKGSKAVAESLVARRRIEEDARA